jgi:hypothetical protein
MLLPRISFLALLLMQAGVASAQVYKCVPPKGEPVYQQGRCPAGYTSQPLEHQKRAAGRVASTQRTETLTVTEGATLVAPDGGVYQREGDMLAPVQGELAVKEGTRVLVRRSASFQLGDKLVEPQPQGDRWVVFRVVPAPAAAPASAASAPAAR